MPLARLFLTILSVLVAFCHAVPTTPHGRGMIFLFFALSGEPGERFLTECRCKYLAEKRHGLCFLD